MSYKRGPYMGDIDETVYDATSKVYFLTNQMIQYDGMLRAWQFTASQSGNILLQVCCVSKGAVEVNNWQYHYSNNQTVLLS